MFCWIVLSFSFDTFADSLDFISLCSFLFLLGSWGSQFFSSFLLLMCKFLFHFTQIEGAAKSIRNYYYGWTTHAKKVIPSRYISTKSFLHWFQEKGKWWFKCVRFNLPDAKWLQILLWLRLKVRLHDFISRKETSKSYQQKCIKNLHVSVKTHKHFKHRQQPLYDLCRPRFTRFNYRFVEPLVCSNAKTTTARKSVGFAKLSNNLVMHMNSDANKNISFGPLNYI